METDQILGDAGSRIDRIRKGDAALTLKLPPGVAACAGAPLRIEQTNHAFRFGGGILYRSHEPDFDPEFARQFIHLFNFATILFHWGTSPLYRDNFGYENTRDRPLEQDRRTQARWCADNGILAKGHALLFKREPAWLQKMAFEEMEAAYHRRLRREIGTFRGMVDCWDVVNEPTNMKRDAAPASERFIAELYARYSITEIMKRSYATAREANPDATLLVNDYDTSDAYRDVVARSLDAGAGLDAVGIQSHMTGGVWSPGTTWETCERFRTLGLPLHLTEVSLPSGAPAGRAKFNWASRTPDWISTPEGEQLQAEEAAAFYTVLFSHPAVQAITWWDFSDASTFLDAPIGLLRRDFSPKPSYLVLERLIKHDWMTTLETRLPASGTVNFRGFFGDYAVHTEINGRPCRGVFALPPSAGPAALDVQLEAQSRGA